MARVTHATAAEVRAFARENNIPVGQRGKFNKALVEAFNKGRSKAAQYVEGTPATVTRTVKVEDKNGRKRTREVLVNPTEARAWAVAQGVTSQTRGRLSNATLDAYALSTLS